VLEEYEFDVAISFAGSERVFAQAIHAILIENGLRVFLDDANQAEIWGTNLVEYLDELYRERAKYCLILVSRQYNERIYTNVERRSALDRMIQEKQEYVLPVKVDDAWIQGVPQATAYIDLRTKGVVTICDLLLKKLLGSKAPTEIEIPPDLRIPRIPFGHIPGESLKQYFIEYCRRQPVSIFGVLVYDERTAEYRKLLRDNDYWDALDLASGPDFEIFAIRDAIQAAIPKTMEMVTAASLSRSLSRTRYYSKLLADIFGEDDTSLAYPSVLIFLVEKGCVSHSRLIPLRRGTVEEVFLRLQQLFELIASGIKDWKSGGGQSTHNLWEKLKDILLEENYTIYIQSLVDNQIEISINELLKFREAQI